jgi:NAD(P) transhydrogenase subunit alpha
MKIGIPKEGLGETRVASSPDVVKKLIGLGFSVTIEKDAGASSTFSDESFKEAGASISKDTAGALKNADVVLKVQSLNASGAKSELSMLKKGAVLIAGIGSLSDKKNLQALEKAGITCFDMELMPRITRAQSMDIISSQSNLAGYKSVLDAASEYGSVFPMMMTAAGTVAPARVFIMGVGVAGLQAIATAKRLGAIVSATDVRPATKEQIESLGAKFLEVDAEMEKDAQTETGHAKQMPPEYFEKQKQIVSEHIKKQDIVITTALIPGRPAPVLVSEDMVKSMRPGSVIVDLAVGAGGNCPLSELGKVVEKHGVKIVGFDNVPGRLPKDASTLYATNILNFITPHVNSETNAFNINWEDETITGTCIIREGKIVHPRLIPLKTKNEPASESSSKVESKKLVTKEA